jgi:hypothetical protein
LLLLNQNFLTIDLFVSFGSRRVIWYSKSFFSLDSWRHLQYCIWSGCLEILTRNYVRWVGVSKTE